MFSELKDDIRHLVLPFAAKIPLSPNSLTLIGLLVSFVSALAFAKGELFSGALLILLSGLFDMLDGAVARARDLSSSFGAFLDSVCDRYADGAIFVGITYGFISGSIPDSSILSIPAWLWTIIAIVGSYLVSYTRARAEAAGASSMNVGIAERPERMLIIVAGALAGLTDIAIFLIVVLTHVTIIQRILRARSSLG
ncbi:CDP-alcohol phosphatidyltransferase family protein [Methanolobus sp. ZRKC3]|uniref:CDP-alcohol phosphatidyltransferase family protein n=1 Tax=Methanolobus sp. ZRKC3 TaxID=3125786 RepID=UPI003246AB24